MNDVIFIIYVILFWAVLFVLALWVMARMLRTPTEAELEQAAEQADGSHSSPSH